MYGIICIFTSQKINSLFTQRQTQLTFGYISFQSLFLCMCEMTQFLPFHRPILQLKYIAVICSQ
uniref:Uncharacterized protein n=1 Tax=Ursus americanus TaxID=9643 RepID=A0A452QPB5_URSAM